MKKYLDCIVKNIQGKTKAEKNPIVGRETELNTYEFLHSKGWIGGHHPQKRGLADGWFVTPSGQGVSVEVKSSAANKYNTFNFKGIKTDRKIELFALVPYDINRKFYETKFISYETLIILSQMNPKSFRMRKKTSEPTMDISITLKDFLSLECEFKYTK